MTTLGDVIERARFRSNTEESQFVTDAELVLYVNDSLAELDDLLVDASEDYKVSTDTATISSVGTPSFDLPDDFLKLRGVDRIISSTESVTLFPFTMQGRNQCQFPGADRRGLDVRYRVQDASVFIIPAASSLGTYRVWYVPKWTALEADDDLPTYMDSQAWFEYAVLDVCIKILLKQDLDPSGFMAQKAAKLAQLTTSVTARDAGPPERMVNTRRGRRASSRWPT